MKNKIIIYNYEKHILGNINNSVSVSSIYVFTIFEFHMYTYIYTYIKTKAICFI